MYKCCLLLDKISKQIKSQRKVNGTTQDDVLSNVDENKKHPPKPPVETGLTTIYLLLFL